MTMYCFMASGSFLIGVVIGFPHGEALPLRFHEPLVGVRVSDDISGGIAGDNVIQKVGCARVFELVRLSRRADETVTSVHGCQRIACAKLPRPAEDKIQLPLGRMSVEWKVGCAGRQFGKLDIGWVSAARNACIAGCAKCLGDVTPEEMKTSARRTLLDPLDGRFICVLHRDGGER